MSKKQTLEEFIEKSKRKHDIEYDYSNVNYIDCKTKVQIICPEHGEFLQTPDDHLQGHDCPQCAMQKRKKTKHYTNSQFIQKAIQIHGDKYDYSKVQYVDSKTKVQIICPEHGDFWQVPSKHLQGQQCMQCAIREHALKQTDTLDIFIKKAQKVHGVKYDYTKSKYIDSRTKIAIVCPEHGEFWQMACNHLQGYGWPVCGGTKKSNTEEWISKAIQIHGNKYDYSKVKYTDSDTQVCIICPEHGEFWQRGYNHLGGCGCPKCSCSQSKPELEIIEFLKKYLKPGQIIEKDRKILNGYEIDILLPDFNIGIEFNGLYWHSHKMKKDINYHRDKMLLANQKDYRLIQIFEDEWLERKEVVLNRLRHVVNGDVDNPTIGARKCTVRQINGQIAKDFLKKYHIQGYVPATIYLGAYYKEELVGVMTFIKGQSQAWNMPQFVTKPSYKLPGLIGKMLKFFVRNYQYSKIQTTLDLRWNQSLNNNTIYDKLGFNIIDVQPPQYQYIINNTRISNIDLQSVNIETDNKIYDCGYAIYQYCNKKPQNQ